MSIRPLILKPNAYPGVPASAGDLSRGDGPRFVGIDAGAETIKVVELIRHGDELRCVGRALVEHHGDVAGSMRALLDEQAWAGVAGAAVTGRLGRHFSLPAMPLKQAQAAGARQLFGPDPLTLVSIGRHGFSILELRGNGVETFRENSRCSQGTGNFLRQLVGRFALTIEEANALCAPVERAARLSGRCPVILKTDMTHLANKGEDKAAILAGLFDAVCENVLVLLKPGRCPLRVVLIGGVARSERIRRTFDARLRACGLELSGIDPEDGCFVEAFGAAVLAASNPTAIPAWAELTRPPVHATLETVPALRAWQSRVRRMRPPRAVSTPCLQVVLGFDLGSTGAKIVALDARARADLRMLPADGGGSGRGGAVASPQVHPLGVGQHRHRGIRRDRQRPRDSRLVADRLLREGPRLHPERDRGARGRRPLP